MSYMSAEEAKKHYDLMSDMFQSQINESISKSKIYDRDSKFTKFIDERSENKPNVVMSMKTTTDAVFDYCDGDTNVCALNFASYRNPGGAFMNPVKVHLAQEECLCATSSLANVICDETFLDEYEYNRNHLNDNLYEDWAIYSPKIMFSNEDEDVACNIITCPAPNAYRYFSKIDNDPKKYEDAMNSRLKFVLDIAEEQNTETLILGAFGCGVFGNNPQFVAEGFKNLLDSGNYSFKTVVFAIPGGGENYSVFESVFEK